MILGELAFGPKTSAKLPIVLLVLLGVLLWNLEAIAAEEVELGDYKLKIFPEKIEPKQLNRRVVECNGTPVEFEAKVYEKMQSTAKDSLNIGISSELELATGLSTPFLKFKANIKAAIEAKKTLSINIESGIESFFRLKGKIGPHRCFKQLGYFELLERSTTISGIYDPWGLRGPYPIKFRVFKRELGEFMAEATYTQKCGCLLPENLSPIYDGKGRQMTVKGSSGLRTYILPIYWKRGGSIYVPVEKIPDEHRKQFILNVTN